MGRLFTFAITGKEEKMDVKSFSGVSASYSLVKSSQLSHPSMRQLMQSTDLGYRKPYEKE